MTENKNNISKLELNNTSKLEELKKHTETNTNTETTNTNTETTNTNTETNNNEKFTLVNSIKENYLSWIFIFIAIFFISPNNYFKGIVSFFIIIFLAYFIHVASHKYDNILTILHKYHHNNNNFFSHLSQCLLELEFPAIFLPFYYIFGNILDEWVILFSVLFYSSVHNINYGCFRVNNVHSLHHKNYLTNIGPDVCDIIFGTKNHLNEFVENTDHYIPNILIATIFVVCLKYFYYSNETFKNIFKNILITFLISCLTINIIGSIVIYYKLFQT